MDFVINLAGIRPNFYYFEQLKISVESMSRSIIGQIFFHFEINYKEKLVVRTLLQLWRRNTAPLHPFEVNRVF